MRRCVALVAWLFALGSGWLACGAAPADPARTQPLEMPALEVEFSGCERVLAGPVCVLTEPATIQLWIRSQPGTGILLDGGPLPGRQVQLQGGTRVALELGPAHRKVEVSARLGAAATTWRLPIDSTPRPTWFLEALSLLRAGEEEAGRALLEANAASPDPRESGPALGLLARLDMAAEPELAEQRLRAAILARRRAGELSGEVRDSSTLAYLLLEREGVEELRALLDQLPDPAGHADSAYFIAFQRGQLADRTGDLRTARRELSAGWRQARRLGLDALRLQIEGQLVLTLAGLGRFAEAVDLWRNTALDGDTPLAGELDPCLAGQLMNNRAWALLLAREAGEPTEDPMPLLHGALEHFEGECHGLPEEASNVRLNLALAAVQRGEGATARSWLERARQLDAGPRERLDRRSGWHFWSQDIEARLDLTEGRARRAADRYALLERQARQTLAPEAQWRALVGQAQARALLGEPNAALDAFARADALLDRELLLVPMHRGRDSFLGRRQRATRQYLDLLLEQGRDAETLAVIRRARSRYLRSLRRFVQVASLPPKQRAAWDRARIEYLAARARMDSAAEERWRLPADQLDLALAAQAEQLRALADRLDQLFAQLGPTPAAGDTEAEQPALRPRQPGELLLAVHRIEEGWMAVVEGDDGVRGERLGVLDPAGATPEELGRRLLEPFAEELRRASGLRVLASGAMQAVDFHALPFGDRRAAVAPDEPRTLGDALAVSYGADLLAPPPVLPAPPRGLLASARGGVHNGEALVVGDPSGNLPAARAEARATRLALLASRSFGGREAVVHLLLREDATPGAVRRLLPAGGLFHYAGHARHEDWESYLPLAARGRLSLDDVMALERAPARVVLSGCETAASARPDASQSISLAHAFLVAGAEEVVAATRPVGDRETGLLIEAFYRALPEVDSMAEALRRAQRALRLSTPGADGSAFRVIVP